MSRDWKEQHYIRYANCWEDASLLLKAFEPFKGKGGRFCSICSAGDNSLALLLLEPELVVALDVNPVQIFLAELKIAAIRLWEREKTLEFLGVSPCPPAKRLESFRDLKPLLSKEAADWWQEHLHLISAGVNHSGKFESYFQLFRKRIVPLMWGKRNVRTLMNSTSLEEQEHFYREKLDNRRWNFLFDRFFNRKMMAKRGRDPSFFTYVEEEISTTLKRRAEYALTKLSASSNPYLEYILTGRYNRALPLYLQEQNYPLIKQRLDRLELYQGSYIDYFDKHPKICFHGHNLSDIFEYMNFEEYNLQRDGIIRYTEPSGRLVYWNMMVTRRPPEDNGVLQELSRELFLQDRAFFYKDLIVEEKL